MFNSNCKVTWKNRIKQVESSSTEGLFLNVDKHLLPFFWSETLRQRTKMRKKRISFPIFFFCLIIEQQSRKISLLSVCSASHFPRRSASPLSAAALWVNSSRKSTSPKLHKKKQKKTTHDIFSGSSRTWVAFGFCFNMHVKCEVTPPHTIFATLLHWDSKVTATPFFITYLPFFLNFKKRTFSNTVLNTHVSHCFYIFCTVSTYSYMVLDWNIAVWNVQIDMSSFPRIPAWHTWLIRKLWDLFVPAVCIRMMPGGTWSEEAERGHWARKCWSEVDKLVWTWALLSRLQLPVLLVF